MEMPCVCDCGQVFDLNDGYKKSGSSNVVICKDCHLKQKRIEELENKIEDLEWLDASAAEIDKVRKKIEELK